LSQSPIAKKAIDFIELAKQLGNTSEEDKLYEEKMRASIGRLYYGVFNLLIDRFLNCGKFDFHQKESLRANDAHYGLKNCISKTNASMRTHIDRLRELRNFCDYDLDKDVMQKFTIKNNMGNLIEYDDIGFAYADAMASAITLVITYTNHQKCYDNRGYNTALSITQ